MKSILRYWWLILAWLLAMFGCDFWHFNIMEVFATFAIIIGAIFAFRKWRSDKRKREMQQEMRNTLVNFLGEAEGIKRKCYEKDTEAPIEEADSWATKVYNYLEVNLGKDYAERFQIHEGLPGGFTTLSGDKANVESFLKTRIARLTEFLSELTKVN